VDKHHIEEFEDAYFKLKIKPTLTQRIPTGNFPLFYDEDWDLDMVKIGRMDYIPWFQERNRIILNVYTLLLHELGGEQLCIEPVILEREIYKRHVHFPGIFVNADQATEIRSLALQEISKRHTAIAVEGDFGWEKVLDKSVYKTGLRLPWCTKAGLIVQNTQFHEEVFGVPQRLFYPLENGIVFSSISLLAHIDSQPSLKLSCDEKVGHVEVKTHNRIFAKC
jgi:hypothetical protein